MTCIQYTSLLHSIVFYFLGLHIRDVTFLCNLFYYFLLINVIPMTSLLTIIIIIIIKMDSSEREVQVYKFQVPEAIRKELDAKRKTQSVESIEIENTLEITIESVTPQTHLRLCSSANDAFDTTCHTGSRVYSGSPLLCYFFLHCFASPSFTSIFTSSSVL